MEKALTKKNLKKNFTEKVCPISICENLSMKI